MNNCIKGMNQQEIFMELTKEDMGKCQGCPNLEYSHGMMTCPCLMDSKEESDHEN